MQGYPDGTRHEALPRCVPWGGKAYQGGVSVGQWGQACSLPKSERLQATVMSFNVEAGFRKLHARGHRSPRTPTLQE
jgi:hypothetical protein